MLTKKNFEIEKAVKKLYEAVKDTEYDKKFSWADLKRLSGLENKSDKIDTLYYVVNKVNSMLMVNNQRFLITQYGFGKRVIRPDEHSGVAKGEVKKSIKKYRRAGAILACTNIDDLSESQKTEVINSANKYRTLELFTSDILRRKSISDMSNKEKLQTADLLINTMDLFKKKTN
jgi:hypothetical protein